MIRRLTTAATLGLALLTGTSGCAHGAGGSSDGGEPGVEVEAPDTWDCEEAERRRKKQNDCGRLVTGRYQEWSWVVAGKTRPPTGWTPAREPSPRTTQAKSGNSPKPAGGPTRAPAGGSKTAKASNKPARTGGR